MNMCAVEKDESTKLNIKDEGETVRCFQGF